MCPVPAHPRFENPIRLAAGFDPESLHELSPPARGVRPWTWLADPDTPDDARSRYLARHVRGHGTVDDPARELALQPRSRDEVVAGYLNQHVFFDFSGAPGVSARLSAVPGKVGAVTTPDEDAGSVEGRASSLAFPFAGPVAIVGTTPPAGVATSVVGRRLGEELADFLAGRGIESWHAVAVHPQREWVDHVLVVACTDPGTVFTAAAVLAQPFVSVWRADPTTPAGIVEVVDLADPVGRRVVARGAADLRRADLRTCPLIPGSGCGDLCEQYGGPWVSRSITAATRWEARRARMIRALGCDTCGDGAIKVFAKEVFGSKRQGISIRPDTNTPTRHDRLVPEE
jgi:hypothetical protein